MVSHSHPRLGQIDQEKLVNLNYQLNLGVLTKLYWSKNVLDQENLVISFDQVILVKNDQFLYYLRQNDEDYLVTVISMISYLPV